MMDYRDIVDYVLAVFQKKRRLQPIAEDEGIGIGEIVQKANNNKVVAEDVAGTCTIRDKFPLI